MLDLKKFVDPDPDWKSLIGKRSNAVEAIVIEKWSCLLKTYACGVDGLKCIQYQNQDRKVVMVFDRDDCLLDVFEYCVDMDRPLVIPK